MSKKRSTLDEIMLATGTDKNSQGHGYSTIYDDLFTPWRDKPITFLELGVWEGASLRAWAKYFADPHARIFGADNDLARVVEPFTDERITVMPAQLDNLHALSLLVTAIATPIDIVVDDASHHVIQHMMAFDAFWPRIVPGGLYVIEDLHTYWWTHNPQGASGWLHQKMDSALGNGAQPKDNDCEIARVLVYPSMVVFQKRV